MRFIGDVHGKLEHYLALVGGAGSQAGTIQLGDMGLGFPGVNLPELAPQHRFIRGNHDDPAACRKHPNYLGDFGYLPDWKLFYAGGGLSIDRSARVAGTSWWPDEELTCGQMEDACELYLASKPRIVISHEGPVAAILVMFPDLLAPWDSRYGPYEERASRTANWLQHLLEEHQPELWFFGHWHETTRFDFYNTTFICLSELDTADLA